MYVSKHLKHMKHPNLSLRKTSTNMFRNIYNPTIQILFIVLDCLTCLYNYIFEIDCELDFYTRFDLSYSIIEIDCKIRLSYHT